MTTQSHADAARTLRGIAFMAATIVIFSLMDAMAKYLSADYPTIFILWVRYVFQFLFMVALFVRARTTSFVRTKRLPLQVGRAMLNVASTFAFIFGLAFLPLADAVALNMVGPLFLTALSVPLLGEKVGIRRWSAVGVGFVGALIVIRPGMGVTHWAGSLMLLSALIYALYQIATRKLSSTDPPMTTLFYTTMTGLLVTSVLIPFFWTDAPFDVWALLAIQGGMGTAAHLCLITALGHAPASTLAPFNYGTIVIATILGYVIFHQFPDHWTIVGALVIIASGLYVIHRETVRRRERQQGA
ncbi:MAG: DMT family transporter [Alphaproteobacteria bacterium]